MPGRRFRIIGLRSVVELYSGQPESCTELSRFARLAHTRRGCAAVLLWRKLRCAAREMPCNRRCSSARLLRAGMPGAAETVLAGARRPERAGHAGATRQDRRFHVPSEVPGISGVAAGRAWAARAIAGSKRGD